MAGAFHRYTAPPFALEGSHTLVKQTAGHDVVKVAQVYIDVERHPMRRDPGSVYFYPDGAYLVVSNPDTREVFLQLAGNSQITYGLKQCILDVANVTYVVESVGWKLENGIRNELLRAMIRDVSAAIDMMDRNTSCFEFISCEQNVRYVASASQGVGVRMLQ